MSDRMVDKRVGLLTKDLVTTRQHSERALKEMFRAVREDTVKARRAKEGALIRARAAEARLADAQARLRTQRERARTAERKVAAAVRRAERAEAELAEIRSSTTWRVGRAALVVPLRVRRFAQR